MKLISRFILAVISNSVAIMVASHFLPGFLVSNDITIIVSLSAVLSLINLFIRPLIKFILTPLIILTLGLLSFAINAGMLYFLDFLSQNITINSLRDLIIATLIFSLISVFINFSAKNAYKHDN